MSDVWNPAVYNQFATERSQPFHDLLALIQPGGIRRAVDLGCGTGELTQLAIRQLEIPEMMGIDNSAKMLADTAAIGDPNISFELGEIATWTAAPRFDLVLANASLQWVPDHALVLRRWVAALAPGGQVAVQVPANAQMPSHEVAREVANYPQFAAAFGPDGPPPDPVDENVLEPHQYAQVLFDLGFEHQHVRLQIYPHLLDHSRSVIDWVRGTMLTRFQQRLDPETFAEFVAAYERRLIATIGDRAPYFFPFQRILLWGRLAR